MSRSSLHIGVLCIAALLVGCGEQQDSATSAVEMPTFQDDDLKVGRGIWLRTCRACHLLGVQEAPAVTDFAQWDARLPKGRDSLYLSVLSGIRGDDGKFRMPPRGGNDLLSDQQVKLAVDYKIAAIAELRRRTE